LNILESSKIISKVAPTIGAKVPTQKDMSFISRANTTRGLDFDHKIKARAQGRYEDR
jgi:hypothetical protein